MNVAFEVKQAIRNIANLGASNIRWARHSNNEGLRNHYLTKANAYILSARHFAKMTKISQM